MSMRPRRSVLFTPANRPERWLKALAAGLADVAVADLEDAVPRGEKADARGALAEAVATAPATRTEIAVRINPYPSRAARDDIETLPMDAFDLVVVPKAERANDVRRLDEDLHKVGSDADLLLLLETARGVLNAAALVESTERVVAVAFGAEDYAADVGARRTSAGTEVLWARSQVAAGASIDLVHTDIKDIQGLEAEVRFAATLGYRGKLLIHPDQVRPTHEALRPDANAVEAAKKLLAAAEGAQKGGVILHEGRMVDKPLIDQARRLVEWSELPL
jgi:citrate lyase subunit beta / citryl-CoA lyase